MTAPGFGETERMHHEPARRRRHPNAAVAGIARALLLGGVLLPAAACTSSSPAPSPTASGATTASGTSAAAYCDDLQALTKNADQLRALDPSTTSASEVQAIIADAQKNLNTAAQEASGAAAVKLTAIKTAYSALTAALRSLPSSLSATQVFQLVQPQITALVAAVDAAKAGTGCPSAGTSS